MSNSVHAHAIELLRCHSTKPGFGAAVHLDIGAGAKADFAEKLTSALGLIYVAAGSDPASAAKLAERGFETHDLPVGPEDVIYDALCFMLAGRTLLSLSFFDFLNNDQGGSAVLRAVARMAAAAPALVVLSISSCVPAEEAPKLVPGRLNRPADNQPGEVDAPSFTGDSPQTVLRAAGLYSLDRNDMLRRLGNRHFPGCHPLLERDQGNGGLQHSALQQPADEMPLVWLCAPGPAGNARIERRAVPEQARPFLTILIRTAAHRPHTLREALLCLHGQTDRDMEVLVICNRLTQDGLALVESVIEDQSDSIRTICRIVWVDDGSREHPLNVGIARAHGCYVAILDDDDLPFAHWVETFRLLHRQAPGRILRAACARQKVRNVTVQGHVGLRGEGAPICISPAEFDMIEQLRANPTPLVTLAFPRAALSDLGLQFDKTLQTNGDWDFLMRAAQLLGVVSSTEVTSICRRWAPDGDSRSSREQEQWNRESQVILARLDELPLLLPPGSASRLRRLLEAQDREEARSRAEISPVRQDVTAKTVPAAPDSGRDATSIAEIARLRQELADINESLEQSITLRFARLTPQVIRRAARRSIRIVQRMTGGRLRINSLR